MRKAAVVSHFGSQVEVARALGITKSAVSQWAPERIPFKQAMKVHSLTHGQVPIDMADYGLPTFQSRSKWAQRATA